LATDQQEYLAKFNADIEGAEVESFVFNLIQKQKDLLKDCVIINGWTDFGWAAKKKKSLAFGQKELDFLIISRSEKSIVHLEVKTSCSKEATKIGFEQLQKGIHFLTETVPFEKKEDWRLIRAIFFGKKNEHTAADSICKVCQKFVLGPETDFGNWWKENVVATSNNVAPTSDARESYLNILKILFFQMYAQSDCITNTDLIRRTDETTDAVASVENILFWTRVQKDIMSDSGKTRVAFISNMGTGKTTLLMHKAKELLKQKLKVFYVIVNDTTENLLAQTVKQKLKDADVRSFQTGFPFLIVWLNYVKPF
jgi:hypothetical protein